MSYFVGFHSPRQPPAPLGDLVGRRRSLSTCSPFIVSAFRARSSTNLASAGRIIFSSSDASKYPPAKPGALGLGAPQRGQIPKL